MSASLLAKLTAHGVPLDGTGGGTPAITSSDVSAALAGLPHTQERLIRLKYTGDGTALPALVDSIAWRMLGECMNRTEDPGPKLATRLAVVVVSQVVNGHICPECEGTGSAPDEEKGLIDCPGCKATGRQHMTHARASELAGVSVPTYRKHWQKLVKSMLCDMEAEEGEALRHIAMRLR